MGRAFASRAPRILAVTTDVESERAAGRAPRSVALVTGASSGIGRAFARRLAERRWDLVLTARDAERLESLAGELRASGSHVEVLPADLADASGLAAVEARAARGVEMVVHAAGLLSAGPFVEQDRDREEELVRVMALAPMRVAHASLPHMLRRGRGVQILVSSRAAFDANPRVPVYAATKAFVNSLGVALAEQVDGSGVRVLVLCPGNTRTELFERAGVEMSSFGEGADPDRVADHALRALARTDPVTVPGEGARDRLLRTVLPARLTRKAASVLRRLSGR
jgi:short-subunit dehydrogenase